MALNTPLSTLRKMLKAELFDNPTVGTANDTNYNQLLSNKQLWMAGVYDFPMVHKEWNFNAGPGSRFVAYPNLTTDGVTRAIDFQRPVSLLTFYTGIWMVVPYGIDPEREYNTLNPEILPGNPQVQTNDPFQRWRMVGTQFEVWPVNATLQTLKFRGQMVLDALVLDSDTADLDDMFLVLAVAVEILAKRKDASAQAKLGEVQNRLATIRAVYSVRDRPCVVGGRGDSMRWQKNVPIVLTAGSGGGSGSGSGVGSGTGVGGVASS